MNTMRNAVAFLATLFFSVQVFAETVIPCPAFKDGTRLTYAREENGRKLTDSTLTLVKVGETTIEGRYGQRTTLLDRNLNTIAGVDGVQYSPKYYRLPECPMKLGQKTEYKNIQYTNTKNNNVTGNVTTKVGDSFKTIKTLIGELRVVEVETTFNFSWQANIGGYSGGGRTTVLSLVTEDGVNVKYSTTTDGVTRGYELTSIPLR